MRVVTVGILRASDAIHVATALIVARDTSDLAFLTADRRQAAAAEAEGLTVVYVGE